MLSINHNIKSIIKKLADVHDKQLPFATSLAINNTAKKVKAAEEKEIRDVFDRPTLFTQNSLFIKPSNKTNLTASVKLKDEASKGVPAAKYLQAEIKGGERRLKRYEVALRAAGVLPEGYFTVPGEAAKIDAFGNMSRGQINQILSYFRANRDATQASTDRTRAKLAKGTKKQYGISYFASRPGNGKLPFGIWMKVLSSFGTAVRPVLIFVQSARYEAIYDFKYVADVTIQKHFNNEFIEAWKFAQRTAK